MDLFINKIYILNIGEIENVGNINMIIHLIYY